MAAQVRYLNYRASSVSGNAFQAEKFSKMSTGLSGRIKATMNLPVLETVRIFGRSPVDRAEEQALRKLFDDIDIGNTGKLDKMEVQHLFRNMMHPLCPPGMALRLPKNIFCQIWTELDIDGSGEVRITQFQWITV